jgi:pimeloyl-ACP methyl ester carboxylesterase
VTEAAASPVTPRPPRDGIVHCNGAALHYVEWDGPPERPLLFLHGGSAHARWWDFVVAELAGAHRCLALDLRGHGDSAWSEAGDYRLDTHAADVAAVVAALRLDAVTLVGHSFGGFVAIRYAATRDPRLAALAIVDSRARITIRSARLLEALRKLPHPRYASLDEAVRRFRLMPSATTAPPEVMAHVVRHAVVQLPDGSWTLKFDRRALASTPAQDLAPALAAVTCPVLVVRGGASEVVSPAALDEFRAAAPHAVTAEIAAAHHHVMLDAPRALAGVLRRFVASLPPL